MHIDKDIEELKEIIKNSDSKSQFARNLGFKYMNGTVARKINTIITEFSLDTSHFDGGAKRLRKKTQKYPAINKTCPICKKKFETKSGHPKEKTTCSHGCSNSFFRSWDNHPNWKNESANKYRVKALRKYGSVCSNKDCELNAANINIPEKLLDVHHLDANRQNNKMSNLRVLCVWCHAKETRKNWQN